MLFDIEVNTNNRPLTYIEDDIQYPVIRPNSMIHGREKTVLEENPEDEDESDWKKRQRYIKRSKDLTWRWQREYLTALRGKHSVKHKSSDITIKVGELVMVKEEDKRRRTWKIGRIDYPFLGKNGVITGIQIKAPKLFLERQVRLLCSLELYCDNIIDDSKQA